MAGRLFLIAVMFIGGSQQAVAALNAQWKLQDNAASTAVVATVGTDGALTGAGNTSASSNTSGPGTALTRYLLFDGTNDSVNVTTGNATAAKNKAVLTLCCWMYVASADTTGTHRMVYVSTNASAGSTRASIGVNSSGQIVASARAGDGESAQTKTSSSSYDDSTWRHVAVVFDYAADAITIYVDGASVSSTGTISFTATASGNTDSLGAYLASTNSSDYFKGRLADCRIYDSDESTNLSTIMAEKDSSDPAGAIYLYFNTVGTDGVADTLTSGTIEIYEDGGTTQITTAETLTSDFDGVVGLNKVTIDLDDAGFEDGKTYTVMLTGGTVDSVSVAGRVVGNFDVNRYPTETDISSAVVGATTTEPTSPPSATSSIEAKINWIFATVRNKKTVTSALMRYFADDGSTVIGEEDLTDSGSTFTKSEAAAP